MLEASINVEIVRNRVEMPSIIHIGVTAKGDMNGLRSDVRPRRRLYCPEGSVPNIDRRSYVVVLNAESCRPA